LLDLLQGEEMSNEIAAIPQLLEMIDIRGATITVDAMGCQKMVAEKVIERGADYVMSLKGNQGMARNLHRVVVAEVGFACPFRRSFRDTAQAVARKLRRSPVHRQR